MPGAPLASRTCSCELDNLGRPTRREGHSQGAWRTVFETLRRFLTYILRSYAQWQSSRCKQPEGQGFDSLRARQLTHYCVIRRDLPLGVLGAQLVHAAGESSPGGLPVGTIAVALAARDESHLEELERKLIERQIPHRAIREPDSPWNGALMSIGIEPVTDRCALKPVTGSLGLLK